MKEKLAILDQLENQTITAEEAERLLQELKKSKEVQPRKGKTIKVYIKSNDGDVVNVQVPVQLAKYVLKGSKHFSKAKLGHTDMDVEAILDLVNQGDIGELVNIESSDGDIVKVYVE